MTTMTKEMLTMAILNAVTEDVGFCKAFVAAEDAESLQAVLQEYGFEVSVEMVEELFRQGMEAIAQYHSVSTEELSEDQLEDVSGGGKVRGTVRAVISFAAGFGYGCLCGIAPAASAGAPYVAGTLAAWSTAGYMKSGW